MLRTDLSRDNSLIADVRRARFITPWWLAIPLGAALLPVVTALLAPLAALPLLSLLKGLVAEPVLKAYFSSIVTILAYGFAALALFLWVRLVERRPFHTIGFRPRRMLIAAVVGIAIALLFTTVIVAILAWVGLASRAPPGADPVGVAALQGIIVAAVMYTVQASTEEMIYRGWLQNVLALRPGAPIAILLTTIAFTFAHADNDGFGVMAAINLALFAIFLSLLALRTGGLWASCAWHAAWNWSLNNLWGVPLSGIPPEGGSAMSWALTGPSLLTGGTWGPEGGLLATAALAGGIVWAGLWRGLGNRTAAMPAPSPAASPRLAPYRTPQRH